MCHLRCRLALWCSLRLSGLIIVKHGSALFVQCQMRIKKKKEKESTHFAVGLFPVSGARNSVPVESLKEPFAKNHGNF